MRKIILGFILVFLVSFVYSVECPKGIINEEYPGSCGLYTDTNNNELCDLSETNEDLIDINANVINNSGSQKSFLSSRYNFILITLITTVIYLISWFLTKKQKLSVIVHKKIWNFLLLITFIITALTSIFYLVRIDLGFEILPFSFISFWHVEIGLVMVLISIFHALWHLPYFKSYLKINKSKE